MIWRHFGSGAYAVNYRCIYRRYCNGYAKSKPSRYFDMIWYH